MSKATHGVYEGCWYYELSFHPEEKGHARVGWSQISGDLQAPCGYDQFSYSYRDSPEEGDVLGIMITLPTPTDMDNLFRTKLMEKLPGSEIRYFKNGVDLGVAFTDLYQGKYYPAVSSYMSGTVTLNFGPTFKHALPNGARAYSDVPKVLAWADLALYSYEPFYVADREPARSAPAIATLGVHLGASPKRRERDFSYNGGGSFGARRTGTKKKKRSLVKKSAIVSAAAVAAGTGDVEVSNDVSVAVTVPLAQEGDEKAVSGELAEDMDEDDAGELEDGEGDSDAESHETPMSDAGEKEIVGGVDATLSL
ncbi:concanavalin A-like lectin/glucanase domain-containing protein [Chytriomyces sp. MP71]|nr:concanavalin A-like lectin/glucanase domain-containing protein [Chytriomyces sp. MP71]